MIKSQTCEVFSILPFKKTHKINKILKTKYNRYWKSGEYEQVTKPYNKTKVKFNCSTSVNRRNNLHNYILHINNSVLYYMTHMYVTSLLKKDVINTELSVRDVLKNNKKVTFCDVLRWF